MANIFQNAISRIGQAINAPVVFDWETNAALEDAQNKSSKRDAASQAYNTVYSNQEAYRQNGNIYNYAGDVIGTYAQANASDPSTSNSNSGYYGGSGVTAAQLAEYDQAIGQLEHGIGRLDTQLGTAYHNIENQYNQKQNELAGSLAKGQQEYGNQTTSNSQQLRTNKNTINDKESNGLRSLLRSLGSIGAVGSDLQLAGRTVNNESNQERAGAGQTYAQNQRSLDTNWNSFQGDIENERKKVADWKTEQSRTAEEQSKTTRQNLLTQLANLRAQKASAQGYNGATAARADLNSANALSGEIDTLGRYTPTYTGQSVAYSPASLDSYQTRSGVSAQIGDPSVSSGQGSNASLLLNDKDEDKRQRNLYI